LVNATDFGRISWSDYDVLIMPSGNYRFLNEKTSADQLKDWISKGGRLIALEELLHNCQKLIGRSNQKNRMMLLIKKILMQHCKCMKKEKENLSDQISGLYI
jgi:hypothetical protein